MIRRSAVVFPDIVPTSQVLIPLVPVFEQVVYCQPVENDIPEVPPDPLCAEMIEQSFCRLYPPAPLGGDRERFLQLVGDLQRRRDDYAAQLTHVSLASLSTGSHPVAENRSSIVSALLTGHGVDGSEGELRQKILWQARLVLKLGEQYDADQQWLAEKLHTVEERERDLFAGLSREDGNPFSLTEKLSSSLTSPDRLQGLRLKAWARLYAFATTPLDNANCFITTDRDAIDRLGEEYERGSGHRMLPDHTLSLPVAVADEKRFTEQVRQFRSEAGPDLEYLFDQRPGGSDAVAIRQLDALNETLKRFFPREECDRCRLALHLLPEVRIKQLLLASFGHDEEELRFELADEPPRNTFMGLLEKE